MKKIIVLTIVISTFLFSCYIAYDIHTGNRIKAEEATNTLPPTGSMATGKEFRTVEIEGCEYIVLNQHYSAALAHKGNCKNKIHKYCD